MNERLTVSLIMQRASQEVKDAQMFREKMSSVADWMGRVKLPRELKAKIRAYYAEVCAVKSASHGTGLAGAP